MAGAAANRKRSKSPTPDSRPTKRQSKAPSSSPEEGELEDGEEQQDVRGRQFQTKVPFPFKPAPTSAPAPSTSKPSNNNNRHNDNINNGRSRSTLSRSPSSPPPQQPIKHRLPPKPPASAPSPRRGMDRYIPTYRDEREWERGQHARYLPRREYEPPSTPVPPPPPSLPHSTTQSPSPVTTTAPAPTPSSIPPPQPRPKKPRRPPVLPTDSAESRAYGRTFKGCGKIDDYDVATKVGEGTFGEVHKAVHRSNSTQVALKRILMHNEKEGMPITAIREIKILKKLNHPNIVRLREVIVQRSSSGATSFHMVFPYMDHDLAGLLENERVQLTPSQIKLYMKQLLEGTAYMHANNIIHRDMKAANLLISNTGLLQIADFGLARPFDPLAAIIAPRNGEPSAVAPRYTNCVVTRWYRPPELFLGARRYGGEIDMWGIGCVLGEIFIRRPILMGSSDANQLDLIWQLCGSPSGDTWPDYDSLPGLDGVKRWNRYDRQIKTKFHAIGAETVDLLDKLLTLDPTRRITAVEALDHEWFWSDPMPADPKTLPKYESSHELDKRSKRHMPAPMPAPGMAPGPVGVSGGPGLQPPPHHNLPPPMYNPHANPAAPVSQPPPHSHGHHLPPPLASFGGPGHHHPSNTGPGGPAPQYAAPGLPGPDSVTYPQAPHYPHPPSHSYPPPPPNWRPPANWFGSHPPPPPPLHSNQPYAMGVPPPPLVGSSGGPPSGPGAMGMAYPPPYGQYHGQQHYGQQYHGQRRHHHNHNHSHHNRNNYHNSGNNSHNHSKLSIWPPPGTHGLPPRPNVNFPPLADSGRAGSGDSNGGDGGGGGRGDSGGSRRDRPHDRYPRRDDDRTPAGPDDERSYARDPPSTSALPYD